MPCAMAEGYALSVGARSRLGVGFWLGVGTRPSLRAAVAGAIRPRGNADLVPGAIREDPRAWGFRVVHHVPTGGDRGVATSLRVLASDRDIDVHRVPERLRRVQLLHPDRGAMPERVDAVVVGHPDIAEHSTPEREIDDVGP